MRYGAQRGVAIALGFAAGCLVGLPWASTGSYPCESGPPEGLSHSLMFADWAEDCVPTIRVSEIVPEHIEAKLVQQVNARELAKLGWGYTDGCKFPDVAVKPDTPEWMMPEQICVRRVWRDGKYVVVPQWKPLGD